MSFCPPFYSEKEKKRDMMKKGAKILHTLSTSLKTRRKLSPANFFRSSIVHIPLARSVANNSGYWETSSNPLGVLNQKYKKNKIMRFGLVGLV